MVMSRAERTRAAQSASSSERFSERSTISSMVSWLYLEGENISLNRSPQHQNPLTVQ